MEEPEGAGSETPLEIAERHVRDGEARMERQAEIVVQLIRGGHAEAAELANDLLQLMGKSLALAREHLRLEREISE
ncbi:hypothetical protein [Roseomonas chloroacetimidivorans]|uniref:hypothetical protein n=1 Tax=Roseomonas chloroacetimidivorans TaxID=1766656 RepID=UPI003C721953